MATNVQRWTAFGEALLNRPATAAQLTKLGDAIAARSRSPMRPDNYETLSNSDKAGYCLDYVLDQCKLWMKEAEAAAALKAAAAPAAAIDTEFTKTP